MGVFIEFAYKLPTDCLQIMTDLPARIRLTAPRVEGFTCPTGKSQAFLWDTEAPTLAVRATPTGRRTYTFESRLHGDTLRITIGDVRSWPLGKARDEASRLALMVNSGQDPREVKRQHQAEHEARQAAAVAQAVTVGDLWPQYLVEGRPKRKDAWKPRYRADLEAMALPGGEKKKRGQGMTRPGPLYPLMALPLTAINEDTLSEWYEREAKAGKHQAARALMMFRGFLRWASGKRDYRELIDRSAGTAAAIVDNLPPPKKRKDALESAQIAGWWAGCEQLSNPVASVYLRALLLTGARREEMAALKWADIDFRWRKLTLADKATDRRTIPLTPYLAHLLASLPKRGEYVFASASRSGRITDARASNLKALAHAGVAHLTLHGLRRTYIQQGRKVAPAGVPAQVTGHAPSAVDEGYAILTIDELRPHAQDIEARILELAEVKFDGSKEPGKLRQAM